MDAFEILVLVLSILLGMFLVVGIIVGVIVAKIVSDIRHITQKATIAADNIEHAAEFFKKTSSAAAITKMIGNAIDVFRKGKQKD